MVEIKKSMIEMDGFDRLPDSLILLIFNSVSDVKALIRCRSVSKRFNSLVHQTESLLLKVDCVISPESDSSSLLFTLFKSLLKSIHDLFKSEEKPSTLCFQTSPAQILSKFDRIRHLHIELPAGDLRLENGVCIRWRAEFGKNLRSCVILGFRYSGEQDGDNGGGEAEADFARELKTRVLWTISALIAASARHYLLKEVVKEHKEMERLVLEDREGEGVVVMEREGLSECRTEETVAREWERRRTVVPSVRMRMRHEKRVVLKSGEAVESAMLVVVRPCNGGSGDDIEDAEAATSAFSGGVHGEVVGMLLKCKSYFLEMNSF